ncbi:hypothetical protein Pst134EB_008081 [Puccinia striiformis f. sp. tritici]|nr:hypothetical protein Pst134EB_008081 [Puccinia striiformis f. sp. tritici]
MSLPINESSSKHLEAKNYVNYGTLSAVGPADQAVRPDEAIGVDKLNRIIRYRIAQQRSNQKINTSCA